jgi:hypothetical protein
VVRETGRRKGESVMHYHCEVHLEEKPEDFSELESMVERIMSSYQEGYAYGNPFWDWYQIGGRWTGVKDNSYDPKEDPRNHEVCTLCNGTGFRTDPIGEESREKNTSYICNACGERDDDTGTWKHGKLGPGKRVMWPTGWAHHPGDLMPVTEIPDDLSCYTLIVDGRVFHKREWDNGEQDFRDTRFGKEGCNVKKTLDRIGVKDGFLVTVDYHS